MLERGVTPVVPAQGSVGASGDLAPLAHMTLTLIGEGEAYYHGSAFQPHCVGARRPAPIELGPKEGLALVNGTQVMTGVAALGVLRAERLAAAADVIGAMSLEAYLGTERVFDRRLNDLRPHPGQVRVAANLRTLLAGSEIVQSHADAAASKTLFVPLHSGRPRRGTRLDRARTPRNGDRGNSVTDNPLVFPADGEFISGGNFHGEPIALISTF